MPRPHPSVRKHGTREATDIHLRSNPQHEMVQIDNGIGRPFLTGPRGDVVQYCVLHKYPTNKIYREEGMLFIDLECYPPWLVVETADKLGLGNLIPEQMRQLPRLSQAEYIEQFMAGVQAICATLCQFVGVHITRQHPLSKSNFGVDEACSKEEGGKLSAHVVCPDLRFEDCQHYMKNFIFFFLSTLLYRNDLPIWMLKCPPVFGPGDWDVATPMRKSNVHSRFWRFWVVTPEWHQTCLDTGVYTKWHTLRCTGTPKKVGGNRFLRPYNYNDFWSTVARVHTSDLTENAIRAASDTSRKAWLFGCLEVHAQGSLESYIRPPWPSDRGPPLNADIHTKASTNWNDDVPVKETKYVLPKSTLRPPTHFFFGVGLALKKEDLLGQLPSWTTLPPGSLTRYVLFELSRQLYTARVREEYDKCLEIISEMKEAWQALPRVTDKPNNSLFNGTYRLSSSFRVELAKGGGGTFVTLSQISTFTSIFCPVHESDGEIHGASAFVSVAGDTGLRSIYCSSCCIENGGKPLFEEMPAYDSWDLENIAPDNVTYVNKAYLEVEDCLPKVEHPHIPHVVLIQSEYGTGKTFSVKRLLNTQPGVQMLKRLGLMDEGFGNSASTLVVGPTNLIARFFGEQFRVPIIYDLIDGMNALSVTRSFEKYDEINRELSKEDRISTCVASIPRLMQRLEGDGYNVLLLDELRPTAELCIAPIMVNKLPEISRSLNLAISKAKLIIGSGAGMFCQTFNERRLTLVRVCIDLDCPSIKVLLPDLDYNDPRKCTIIKNSGGVGGLNGCQPYYSKDLEFSIMVLTRLISCTEYVMFVPTNQIAFSAVLMDLIVTHGLLGREKVLLITSETSTQVKKDIIKDCKKYIQENGYRVIIATPTFGTGFSIDKGGIDVTFGFMFQYPPEAHQFSQQMARGRNPSTRSVFIYTQEQGLGHVYKNSKHSHIVDTRWMVDKCMERMAKLQMTFVDVIADIMATNSNDALAHIYQQYNAVKRAEEEVNKHVGAGVVLERLLKVCGVDRLLPMEVGAKELIGDFDYHCDLTEMAEQAIIDFRNPNRDGIRQALATQASEVLRVRQEPDYVATTVDIKVMQFAGMNPFRPGYLSKNLCRQLALSRIGRLGLLLGKGLKGVLHYSAQEFVGSFGLAAEARAYTLIRAVVWTINAVAGGGDDFFKVLGLLCAGQSAAQTVHKLTVSALDSCAREELTKIHSTLAAIRTEEPDARSIMDNIGALLGLIPPTQKNNPVCVLCISCFRTVGFHLKMRMEKEVISVQADSSSYAYGMPHDIVKCALMYYAVVDSYQTLLRDVTTHCHQQKSLYWIVDFLPNREEVDVARPGPDIRPFLVSSQRASADARRFDPYKI